MEGGGHGLEGELDEEREGRRKIIIEADRWTLGSDV